MFCTVTLNKVTTTENKLNLVLINLMNISSL